MKPTITGTARVGQTVQATTGSWTPTADSYRYEWRVDGVPTVTTTKTLKLTAAMRGKAITVTVVAVRAGHTDGAAPPAHQRPSAHRATDRPARQLADPSCGTMRGRAGPADDAPSAPEVSEKVLCLLNHDQVVLQPASRQSILQR
ncbi:hypothetical protein [Micromonospora sp. 050-3]|uniref:hypothetical protein n=1 Tax=Micromonospora sp. 050-3 TaxID=2789265 RepID=UPI00397E6DF1